MSKKSWELTDEEKELLAKGQRISKKLTEEEKRQLKESIEPRNEMQALLVYNIYVGQQEEQFIKVMNFINGLINELKQNKKIREKTEIRARIKAPKSALKNDSTKALDDVFGMEIITETEEDIDIIIGILVEYMDIKKRPKDHDKPNGYKAKHRTMILRRECLEKANIALTEYDRVPMVEYQLKTFDTLEKSSTGPAEHVTYKGEDKDIIQQQYDNNTYDIFNIPTMWVSQDGEMRILTAGETLKVMYPFLKNKKGETIVKLEGEQR